MKKAVSVLLTAVMTLSLIACGSSGESSTSTAAENNKAEAEAASSEKAETAAEAEEPQTEKPVVLYVGFASKYMEIWKDIQSRAEKEGIELELFDCQSAMDGTTLLTAGQLDILDGVSLEDLRKFAETRGLDAEDYWKDISPIAYTYAEAPGTDDEASWKQLWVLTRDTEDSERLEEYEKVIELYHSQEVQDLLSAANLSAAGWETDLMENYK